MLVSIKGNIRGKRAAILLWTTLHDAGAACTAPDSLFGSRYKWINTTPVLAANELYYVLQTYNDNEFRGVLGVSRIGSMLFTAIYV